jgi:hypothetical protein
MYRYLYCLALVGIGTPGLALAAVEISEVAWMGSTASPNHEWIELYNPGSAPVTVDDWTLADGNNLLITLAGTIPAQTYVVLERTSDDSAPGAAFLVYTGALVNTGTTLTLRQSDGQIADQVVGGSDWSAIGGDNATKATAQLVGTLWRTGTPTPGAAPGGTSAPENDTDDQPANPVTPAATSSSPTTPAAFTVKRTGGSSGDTIPLRQATTELTLALAVPAVAYARQPVTMTVTPSGISRTIQDSLSYQWNFGDFTTASGSSVTHRFVHPGSYLVTVRGHYGRHDVVVRQAITVLPVTLSVTRTDEALFLNNDAVYDIDVSGFRVVVDGETMTLPPYSYIAAKQSVRLPLFGTSPLVVRDNRGAVVVREAVTPGVLARAEEPPAVPLPVATAFVTTGSINTPPIVEAPVVATTAATMTTGLSKPSEVASAGASAAPSSSAERWPYALLGLVLVGAVGAVLWPKQASSPFSETDRYSTDGSSTPKP